MSMYFNVPLMFSLFIVAYEKEKACSELRNLQRTESLSRRTSEIPAAATEIIQEAVTMSVSSFIFVLSLFRKQ